MTAVEDQVKVDLGEAYRITEKAVRYERVSGIRAAAIAALAVDGGPSADDVKNIFKKIEKSLVRKRILSGEPRIDGRDTRTVRPIACEVDVLSKVHGSALFTRGETQAIGAVTLGSTRDSQIIDALEGERRINLCCTITSPPIQWVKSDVLALQIVAKWVMVVWRVVVWPLFCLLVRSFPTPSVLCLRSRNQMARARWLRFVLALWR